MPHTRAAISNALQLLSTTTSIVSSPAPVQVFPFAGHRHGKAAVLTALGGIAQDYALERYVPQVMIVEDDRAAVMSDGAFKQRSTGRMITAHLANFLRFRDGRIIEFREFANTFDLVEQAIGHFIEVG